MFLTEYDSANNILGRLVHGASGHLVPPVDIVEKDDAWVCSMDLPGVALSDIDIKVKGDTLEVSAQRSSKKDSVEGRYARQERSFGNFYRVFTLPAEADSDNVTAHSNDGVLEIHIARRKNAEGRKIEVVPATPQEANPS